jgi:hypothetical protein
LFWLNWKKKHKVIKIDLLPDLLPNDIAATLLLIKAAMGTIRFNLRTDKPDKQFKCPIELVYQISGQRKYYALKDIKLHPLYWDREEQVAVFVNPARAKKQLSELGIKETEDILLLNSEVEQINDHIAAIRADVRNIEKRFELDSAVYSASMVIDA